MADINTQHPYQSAEAAANVATHHTEQTVNTAAVIAEQAAKIQELKKELDASRLKGENRTIEVDGEQLPVKAASSRYDEAMQDLHLLQLKADRMLAEHKAATSTVVTVDGLGRLNLHRKPEPSAPVLNRDSAEQLFGRVGWAALSNEQKANVLDVRNADIEQLRVEDYFGVGTSQAANDLSKSRPGVYKLLRQRAVQKGIIA